ARGGLAHFWRDNDNEADHLPWHRAQNPSPTFADQVEALSLIERNSSQSRNGPGNLELVARVGDCLISFWRPDTRGSDGSPGAWQGPFELVADGVAISRVSGNPALIQSRNGTLSLHDALPILARGGLAHFWRDNDNEADHLPWHRAQNPFPTFADRV